MAEPTLGFPSEEHINLIKYTKYTKILAVFDQIMKHSFSLKIGEVNVKFFGNGVRLVP